jgi:hypothetical protein
MRIMEPNDVKTSLREIQVTIDVSDGYFEMVEIYRENENGPGFVQVTSIKMIEPKFGPDRDNNTDVRRLLQ